MQVGYIKECKCTHDYGRGLDGSGKKVQTVPLDHYIKRCDEPPIPLILAHALYDGLNAVRYGRDVAVVSVTMLTRCPLTIYFEQHHDWWAKVLDTRFMLRGTFAHEGMLRGLEGKVDWVVEQPRSIVLGKNKTVIFGTPDAYYKPDACLYDLKTQHEYSITKKNSMSDDELLADPWVNDNVAQVNCYACMLVNDGLPVERAELQYMDGKLRVRTLPVPIYNPDATLKAMEVKGTLLQRILDKDIAPSKIQPREYTGWKPNTAVDYLVKKEMEGRS